MEGHGARAVGCLMYPGKSSHEELVLHLARLKAGRQAQELAGRQECEALLTALVGLRQEREQLAEEAQRLRRKAVSEAEAEERHRARSERLLNGLGEELKERQQELRQASASLRGIKAEWVIEDEPEKRLERAEEKCQGAKEALEEYREASSASRQLVDRLQKKLKGFTDSAPRCTPARKPLEDLEQLRQEVRKMTVQLEMAEEECGVEAQVLWQDNELPRLRAAERERQQLVGRLGQARWDRDHLERNFSRIINGLREHEAIR